MKFKCLCKEHEYEVNSLEQKIKIMTTTKCPDCGDYIIPKGEDDA